VVVSHGVFGSNLSDQLDPPSPTEWDTREDGLNRAAGRRHLLINQTEHHSPRPPGFHDVAAPASLSINNDQFPESTEWIHQDLQDQKTTPQPPASLLIATAVTTAERHDGSKL
jgi:hypothetical protein